MKKINTTLALAGLFIVIIMAAGFVYQVAPLADARCTTLDCSTPPDPGKTCGENSKVGPDGHCHCNEGFHKAVLDGEDGRRVGCIEGASCEEVAAELEDLTKQYASSTKALAVAEADLKVQTKAYEDAKAKDPNSVKAVENFDVNKCVKPYDPQKNASSTVGCDGPQKPLQGIGGPTSSTGKTVTVEGKPYKVVEEVGGECEDNSAKCDQQDAKVSSINSLICITKGRADAYKTAMSTSTATSTATSTSQVFTLSLSPSTIKQGDTFTMTAVIGSSSTSTAGVQKYSISAYKDAQSLGTLVSGASVPTTARPATVSHSFRTAANIVPGIYTIQISNDANFVQYQNALLTVQASSASGNSSFQQTNGSNTTAPTYNPNNYTSGYYGSTASSYNQGAGLIFLAPTSATRVTPGSNLSLHWGYNSYTTGAIDLYLQTVCSSGDASCVPSTTSIGSNVPVAGVYYTAVVPQYVPRNSWMIVVAKQGANVVGYSQTFLIGY